MQSIIAHLFVTVCNISESVCGLCHGDCTLNVSNYSTLKLLNFVLPSLFP